MADLSKIKLNGTTYNFKDTAARNDLDSLADVASTGDYTDLQNTPTNVSDFVNDAGYLTSFTETDPTVPAWAKAANKPTYTAGEVGAASTSHNHNKITYSYGETVTTLTAGDNLIASFTRESPSGTTSTSQLTISPHPNNNVSISGLATPTGDTYAANKKYVDDTIAAIDKIQTTAGTDNTEYNLIGTAMTNANTSAVNVYQPTLLSFSKYTNNFARLTLGSTSTPGEIRIYTSAAGASGYTDIKSSVSGTSTRTITLPDATGTVALTSDIPSISSWALASSKPSYTFSELTTHPTSLQGYGITDAYTKTEVDGLVSGVLHYKGTKATVSALPSSGNVVGDVWHVTADAGEYAWDGSTWQELGSNVDLSGYVPTSRTINNKALTGNISLTASDVGALSLSTTYVSSFNGSTGAITYTAPVTSVNGQTGAVTTPNTTYTLSISGNRITLTPSSGSATYVDLPVFNGSVT